MSLICAPRQSTRWKLDVIENRKIESNCMSVNDVQFSYRINIKIGSGYFIDNRLFYFHYLSNQV